MRVYVCAPVLNSQAVKRYPKEQSTGGILLVHSKKKKSKKGKEQKIREHRDRGREKGEKYMKNRKKKVKRIMLNSCNIPIVCVCINVRKIVVGY